MPKTFHELARLKEDPRYRDPSRRDPAYVRAVDREFELAYPGQVATAPQVPGQGFVNFIKR